MDHRLILDRYRPLADLGTGGHGSVVLAFDTRLARRVAVKSLPLPQGTVQAGLEEARTAALLAHPGIVTVYEWDTDEDQAHVVTEYVDGADLGAVLDAFGPLDLDAAAAVLAPIASALAFAHENGALHLDVKPENVLVCRDGRVKLADFGIAALTDATGTAAASAGTLGFMPPEQLRGEELDERTDQWALAALAFEALADANPFSADTIEGAIFRAVDVEPAAPSEFEPDLPAALDDILLAALEPDPDSRYNSVGAFAHALLAQLGDEDTGRVTLATMVAEIAGEEAAPDEAPLGLWDRLAPRAELARRVLGGATGAWLAWAGMRPFDVGPVATLGVAALVAAAGAGAPGLGLGLGLLAVSASFFADSMLAGTVFLLAAVAYWVWLGRHGRFPAFAPVLAPAAGVGPFGFAVPLLLGFGASPLLAAGAAAWSSATLQVASAINGNAPPYLDVSSGLVTSPWTGAARIDAVADILVQPGAYVTIVAWALGAAIASVFARQGTRSGAAAGIVLAAFVLVGAYGVWGLFDPNVAIDTGPVLEHAAGSLILMTVIVALGAPTRGEAE